MGWRPIKLSPWKNRLEIRQLFKYTQYIRVSFRPKSYKFLVSVYRYGAPRGCSRHRRFSIRAAYSRSNFGYAQQTLKRPFTS